MHNESPPSLVKREVGCARRPRLLDRLREALRSRHYSPRTKQTDCLWVRSYIRFHNIRHPGEMSEPEIDAFLTHLSTKEILIPRRQGAKDRITLLSESLKEGIPSRSRIDHPEGGRPRGKKGRLGQMGHLPHIPSFLRHAPSGKRLRYQDRSGAWPQGRQDDDDLHPCPEPGRQGCQKPGGRFVEEERRCFI